MRNTPYGLVQQQEDEPADRNTTPTPSPHVPVDRDTAFFALVAAVFSVLLSVAIIVFIVLRVP